MIGESISFMIKNIIRLVKGYNKAQLRAQIKG